MFFARERLVSVVQSEAVVVVLGDVHLAVGSAEGVATERIGVGEEGEGGG